MYTFNTMHRHIPTLLIAALLTACGGGGSGSSNPPATNNPPTTTPPTTIPPTAPPTTPPSGSGAPVATGNTATDGFNWFNYRRASLGLSKLTRNTNIDFAAFGHSNYLSLNNTVTHDQTPGNPGFTGITVSDRLANANYTLTLPYAYGEVISAAGDTSGFYHAEELITAIYHRFVVFEPMFKEMGTGSAFSSGRTYFTADLAASNGLGAGLGRGKIVAYPYDLQTDLPTNFFSDTESPDPVPSQNEVGYPVSVHSDITGNITVSSFTIHPRNGAMMATRLLTSSNDAHTSPHEAAIIPLLPLSPKTTYEVSFSGTVDGMAVTKNWSFTTK
ncbi:CAP domain-containing protein [Pseudoduganella violaceinigra]|uniref:CAP domain-containing protein n=1 Tax=Pseudoduganella violaceinigra TaxID=246602 RepID=UPI00041F7953|nr:CAP domain-containing protein [Pseudoduganella violaceinigra]